MLSGPPFAILYSVLGIPFAYLADRTSRSRVIAARAGILERVHRLCAATAGSFWQLFLFRMGVGIGEAGGVAPSYALIADYFAPQRRARALAIFSLGVPIGLAARDLDRRLYRRVRSSWRAAFYRDGGRGSLSWRRSC